MAKLDILKATTDVTVYVFIQNSTLTTGAGLTGLVYNAAGLTCYYVRPLAAAAQLSLATQTVTGAHSDGGFVEVDATNMPGVYRLDLSDAVCATGVNSVVVMLKGATNMAPVLLEIQLVSFNPNDAVRMGLTALPNAAAEAAGGLYTRGNGAGQINQQANGQIDVNQERMLNVAQSVTDLKDFADTGYDPATHKVQGVVLTDTLTTYTGNTPQTGDSFARIGANGAGLTALGDARLANLDALVSSRSTYAGGAVASVTGNVGGNVAGSVGSVTAAVTVGTNNDKTGYALSGAGNDAAADALLKRDLSAVTGEAARSLLNAIRKLMNKVALAAGVLTIFKEDDATTAYTQNVTQDANQTPIKSLDTN